MRVLAVNPGSSSLKVTLLERERLFFDHELPLGDSVDEIRTALGQLALWNAGDPPEAIGVRIVHGGNRFSESVQVDSPFLSSLQELVWLAPLHLPIAIRVLSALKRIKNPLPVVAVFDTHFHRTIPEETRRYALPSLWKEKDGVEKYGFHGLSYDYISRRLPDLLQGPLPPKMVAVHWGNGASVCAMEDGRSVETSMGMTPLDGLVMGTRPGSIDPGIVPMLLRKGYALDRIEEDLNHHSGLFALSGGIKDFRKIEEGWKAGELPARTAFSKAVTSVAMTVGAYAAVLGGLDGLVFSGGVGEHSSTARRAVMEKLAFLGVSEDAAANLSGSGDREISKKGSAVSVWVIHAREDRTIARETEGLLAQTMTDQR